MKIGLFSDLHLKYVGDKIEGMDALNKIVDFFLKEKVDGIIFNGDLFEKRYRFHFKLLYELVKILLKLKDKSFLIFNIGNHDLYEKTGEHALKFLSLLDNVTLIEEPQEITWSKRLCGKNFKFFPYRKEPTKEELKFLKEGGEILFAHQYIDIKEEVVIEPHEFVLDGKILEKYDMVITGHYHIPFATEYSPKKKEQSCQILNLGSARSIDFKDAEGRNRYVYIWDTEKESFKEYDLNFPKHIKITIKDKKSRDKFLDDMNKEDYYLVSIPEKLVNKDLEEGENVIMKREKKEYEVQSRLNLEESFNTDEIVKKYTKMLVEEGDVGKFIEKGKEIIKEAENVETV